jgi:hypothetical protein
VADISKKEVETVKDLTKRIIRAVFLPALLLSAAAAALAHEGPCSTGRVAGTWAYTETGTVFLPTGVVPYASVGKFTVDADGNLLGQRTASAGGKIQQATIEGTVTVNSNCTGTLTLAFYDPQSGSLLSTASKFVVYDDKLTEFRAIITLAVLPNGTSLKTALFTDGKRLFPSRMDWAQEGSCSTASLSGTWGYTFTGTLMLPAPTGAIPFGGVGRATFDADGNVLNSQFSSVNGVVTPSTVEGTITVNSDCTGTIQVNIYDQNGNLLRTSQWFAVVADNVNEIRAILTSLVVPSSGTSVPPVVTMVNKRIFAGRGDEQ